MNFKNFITNRLEQAAISPEVKPPGVMLTIHLRLVPSLRKVELYLHFPYVP
jgi:hypothetical protein